MLILQLNKNFSIIWRRIYKANMLEYNYILYICNAYFSIFLLVQLMKLRKSMMNFKMPANYRNSPQPQSALDKNRQMTRTKKIKEKNVVYPMSNSNKIIFITNQYGIGFKKQKIDDFGCPSHIPIDNMLKEINYACYLQWKSHFEKLSQVPFSKIEYILALISVAIFLIIIIYFFMLSKLSSEGYDAFNYLIISMILIIFGLAIFVCLSRKSKESSLDSTLIEAIQNKLIQFNRNQQQSSSSPRFRWTCHQECLWIALNI